MGDKNCSRACARLKVRNDLSCDKELFNRWECKPCKYYYEERDFNTNIPRCLKKAIKDWTLYQIDNSE